MPNRQKQKGDRHELSVMHAARAYGLRADKIRLSEQAALGGADIKIALSPLAVSSARHVLTLECKKRKAGFKSMYALLEDKRADAVVVSADRRPDLVVIPLEILLALLARRP